MTLTEHDILNLLQTNRPVSIIRAGDGEQIVLNSNESLQAYRTCIDNVMKRQMGYEPTMSEVMAIRDNLITAYGAADIVGLPMHSNLNELNKHWRSVADTVKPLCTTTKFTSTDVCYDMLYSGLLKEWLKGKQTINYISCRNLDYKFMDAFGTRQVNGFNIAPEAKFTSYDGPKHYPDQFNKIERWMSKCDIEGNPCLVGAGVIGKIYCNWFRDRGGVAIDMGAVFDLWAGYATRGPLRGLDTPDNRYKL